jgi:predicted dehydrogenase
MMHDPIGVGIIGVNPGRGWAATAHIPALRALPTYEIRALSASSREAAAAAGNAFDIALTCSDHHELVARPEVDLVVVTVKAPHHRELVTAALDAGKAVCCEWPLGVTLEEAVAMADLAAQKQLPTLVGLQARQAPAIAYARDLVASGYVGEVLSTTMSGSSVPGAVIVQPNAYMLDKANGANLLTVALGHSLDALAYVLGEFRELSALSATRRPLMTILETGEQIVKTAADQVAIMGTLASGATASVHFREGLAGGVGFLWEINGTDATLQITAAGGLPGIYPLTLTGARGQHELVEFSIPEMYVQRWPTLTTLRGTPADNVGRNYAAFAADLQNGTRTAPDFAQAVTRHTVITAIEAAATGGRRDQV